MTLENIRTIAKREYAVAVKSKGFWLATVLLPLFMAALVVLPMLVTAKTRATHRMAIVDRTGAVAEGLVARLAEPETPTAAAPADSPAAEGTIAAEETTAVAEVPAVPEAPGGFGRRERRDEAARFELEVVAPGLDPAAQLAELDRRVLAGEIDSWIQVNDETLASGRVDYRAESVSNFITQQRLESALSATVAEVRLTRAGLDAEKVRELTAGVDLSTIKVSKEGSRKEVGIFGFFLAYFLFFLLYMTTILYGQQVMNGVIEEKSSRVVEVLISTVRPIELMMGKLVGISLVGLTQLGIWMLALVALSTPAILGALALAPSGFELPQVSPWVAVNFLLLFLLGFFFFSTLYAAIGAASNNTQEAQQMAPVLMPFLIGPALLMVPVINDPDSTLAVALSLVPCFTPLLMMLRIAVKMPPLWQILAAYALTLAFNFFMVWMAARIYRTGILMYGKRPTFQELWRWMRHA